MNYQYVKLQRNQVIQIIDVDYPIDKDDHDEWIEISLANPKPQVGWMYDRASGVFAPITQETIILQEAKATAKLGIDDAAGLARGRMGTNILGQAEVYREKYEQAIDFLSSVGQMRYSDYPLLEVDSKILDIPMKKIAENVVKQRSKWISNMTAIENLRMSGKYNMDSCSTVYEVSKLKAHIIHKLNELKSV